MWNAAFTYSTTRSAWRLSGSLTSALCDVVFDTLPKRMYIALLEVMVRGAYMRLVIDRLIGSSFFRFMFHGVRVQVRRCCCLAGDGSVTWDASAESLRLSLGKWDWGNLCDWPCCWRGRFDKRSCDGARLSECEAPRDYRLQHAGTLVMMYSRSRQKQADDIRNKICDPCSDRLGARLTVSKRRFERDVSILCELRAA